MKTVHHQSNNRQLLMWIQEGEGLQQDFKKTISSQIKIAKTIVSFANTRGGRIIIGVNDQGKITGIKSDEEIFMIEGAATFYAKPEVPVEFHLFEVQNKSVLVIEIPESQNKPHYAKDEDGKWWVYIRVKDQTVLASKIVVEVLKRETQKENILIEYSSKEKALLQYLAVHNRITLAEFSKLVNISKRRASRILVNLICSGIIRSHHTEKVEFYTLSE
jgi:predicted HTH transcriptional regulator